MPLIMFSNLTSDQIRNDIMRNSKFYYFNGIMLIVLGILGISSPIIAATFLDVLIALMLLITGLVQAGFSFYTSRHWSYYFLSFIAIIAGLLMLFKPSVGILALGLIVMVYFILQGIGQIASSIMFRDCRGAGWIAFSGLISLMLGVMIYAGWPITATWVLGLMVGINFVVFGMALILLTRYVKNYM